MCIGKTWVGGVHDSYRVKSACEDGVLGFDALVFDDVTCLCV